MQYDDYLYYQAVDSDADYIYDSIIICKCDSSAVEVYIPSAIDGLPVTDIGGNAFYNCENLEIAEIDADVQNLCDIPYLKSLKEINISEKSSLYSSIDGYCLIRIKPVL